MRRVAVFVLVVALLVATAAAFAVTESLKLDRSDVGAPRFPKSFQPPQEKAKLSFRLRHGDRLDIVIVSDGQPVRTLARSLERPRGRVRVRWDGRNDAGMVVPEGIYQVRVDLREAERTIVFPAEIRVDRSP